MNAIFFLVLAFAPGEAPGLACAKPVADLGTTRGGLSLVQKFEVVNRSGAEIAIAHVQPSCGCLVTRVGGRVLKPGEAAEVEVQIGTLSQPDGDNLWSVRLFYRTAGSEADQTLDLHVKARLEREVGLQPAALRLSGKPGLTHEITLTARRDKPLEVTGVAASSGKLAVLDGGAWQPSSNGWVRKFYVRITADCPAGRHDEVVQIFSSDPDYRDMRVPVSVSRTDKLRYLVTPGEANLVIEAGKAVEAMVLIRDAEGRPVEIESVEAEDEGLACRFDEGATATAVVRIRLANGARPAQWSSVRVRVRAPVAQTVVVPVSCVKKP